ncbi:DUF2171 domain-containing protein [Paludisphaera borealis]|uniref:DUF2171 domain-containing protein n=1 Tax=Paludisphaera borealis TaxID=1387353 RepID=A0A1U7CS05_9BACT|nr:DUF2171 domain-containing protein [Paludisphaera borealis]APW61676.1 hypothetical protein BSF38_03201 [Paludisphaera borealis]
MAETYKEQAEDVAQKIANKATEIGHKVSEKAEEATDWVKEKAHQAGHRIEEAVGGACSTDHARLSESTGPVGSVADIKDHMSVYASCGKFMGKVDHVMGNLIKLTKNDSPDGQHHLIPTSWVAKVHDHIHLNKNSQEVESEWRPA